MDPIASLLEEASRDFAPSSIKQLFSKRLIELGITQNQAERLIEIEHKSLDALLDGTSKRVDYLNALKVSIFLRLNPNEFSSLYARQFDGVTAELRRMEKIVHILDSYDLVVLKRFKVLSSKMTPAEVEQRLKDFFGVEDLASVATNLITPAFSKTKRTASEKTRDFWVRSAHAHLTALNNPFPYDRRQLLGLIPKIRPYTMNVQKGLTTVIQALFRAGVTVIHQPLLTNVAVRGATMAVNDKPGIVLTDYYKSYPTLWFALMHELHHVLYDWEHIRTNSFHLTGEPDLFLLNEEKSDKFARDYLFSEERAKYIKPLIANSLIVNRYAREQQIHPSILYNFVMYDMHQEGDTKAWSKYQIGFPNVEDALAGFACFSWTSTVLENAAAIKEEMFTFPS